MRRHAPPVLAALAVMLVGMLCSVHGTAKGGAESSVRERLAARPAAAGAGGAAAARRLNAAAGGRQLRALPDGCTQLQVRTFRPPARAGRGAPGAGACPRHRPAPARP